MLYVQYTISVRVCQRNCKVHRSVRDLCELLKICPLNSVDGIESAISFGNQVISGKTNGSS